jgi:hypothetical protein
LPYTTDDAVDAARCFFVSENGLNRDEKPPLEAFEAEDVTATGGGEHFRVRDATKGIVFDVRRLAPTNIIVVTVVEWPASGDMVGLSVTLVKTPPRTPRTARELTP